MGTPPANLSIRPAAAADTQAVVALLGELGYVVHEPATLKRLTQLQSTGSDPVLIAWLDAAAVGLVALHVTAMLQRQRKVARVTALVVGEAARGRGVGRALLEQAVAMARESGCEMIELTSADGRRQAHAFYRACGFEATARRFHRALD
jgi:GNAT superfamily N-acetyltransferase